MHASGVFAAALAVAALTCVALGGAHAAPVLRDAAYTQPFTRDLRVQSPPMTGGDVVVLQNLINRCSVCPNVPTDGAYTQATADTVSCFQKASDLPSTGVADAATTNALLDKHSDDGYRDDGTIPPGAMYKVHIPVHRNRSIETTATLFAANGTVLMRYTVRTHGQDDEQGRALNQFASDGCTPTGLSLLDLNSPEPDPVSYGPYPINRFVSGVKGNAAFLLPHVRTGILQHTGEWPDWAPPMPMPNSHGCVHGWPDAIKMVWKLLVDMGVVVHQNPFGQWPYPYTPQGVVSVELVD